ncbi:MAG TPA: SHOCT domain-containing protein [Saprospiraceae bacterium]|nr:SHOCT domain-containing protein [Saprospiraceae bacterium]
MGWFLTWILFSFVAAYVGNTRKIGFGSTLLLSLLLSPLIGLIIAFASDKKAPVKEIPIPMLKLINEADKLAIDSKTYEAIEKYIAATTYIDKSPNIKFKIARLYSLMKDGENSLKFLAKAINDGFDNFERIHEDKALEYLKSTPEFSSFVTNGYKIVTMENEQPKNSNRIEDLEKISILFEKGLLTIEEFEAEKKRILTL